MKQVFTILAAVLLTATLWAQSPEKMSYQAVIRNTGDALVINTQVGMQISILQGSAGGTAVYVETQTPTTNANGLVSFEIGTGTVQSGTFATIDWANGPYFIKTETDLAGGTTYTITGTSQLLSVPYALHAKTAETLSGGITETDPIFGASVASGITGTDTTNWNSAFGWGSHASAGYLTSYTETDPIFTDWGKDYTTLTNKPTIDGSETNVTAGTNVTITGSGTTASPYVVSATGGATPFAIGDSYGGGKIFWLDATGQHGLIADTIDQSAEIRWYNGSYPITEATLDAVYAGKTNTNLIIANQGAGSYAAQICADYTVTVNNEYYDDWYLPSKYELNLLYLQKTAVGGFASAYYWSSSEYDNGHAWAQGFGNGNQFVYGKSNTIYVRAVRAF